MLSLKVDITTLRRRRRVPSMGTYYEDYIPLQDLEPDIHLDETLDELTPLMKVSRFRARNNDLTSVVIDPPSSTNPITLQVITKIAVKSIRKEVSAANA
jgi:hypothetical protein